MFQENSIETCILSRVKQITGPGWMHETSARTWCSGRTRREQVGREVGGGIGMGKTCEPKAFSFQCMTKFTTNKIKKKEKKWTKDLNKHFSDEGILMFSKHMKRCLTLGSIRGIQVKTTMRYHFTSLRMTVIFLYI